MPLPLVLLRPGADVHSDDALEKATPGGCLCAEIWRARHRETLRRDWRVWAALALMTLGLSAGLPFASGGAQLAMAVALGSALTTLYVGWQVGGDVRSLSWVWGQVGEEQTEDALKPLEDDGWRVVHDITHRRGNWDHVVVGAAGVFLLDTKSSERRASVRDDRLYLGRTVFNGGGFRGAAKALYSALASSRPPFVQPVVVIWGDFTQERCEEYGATYIAGTSLASGSRRSQ